MTGRICLTPEEAFEAGFEEPCEHLVPDPSDCPSCRLTEAEIRRLVVLLRSDLPAVARKTAA
ncbi:hypothetical protein OIE43_18970 [Streptomyces pseudovenezuelae]|uniref:hypothetical protein n=1 Tax=Streptomyces pseudovenezuelae TaxID=67350 RepID=UPI002E2FD93B|nr:hypothetical protein [Streptomyces pseudovenezuelae]